MENNHVLDIARSKVRATLAQSLAYKNMLLEEQRTLYHDLVREEMGKLISEQQALSDIVGGITGGNKKKDRASDLIDDQRHDKGFTESVDAYEDLVDSVDFPKFVADLLKGVFDANISVMKAQTDDYIRLMKEATKGVAEFIKQIDSSTTFAYLAESKPDEFNISMEEDGKGGETMALTKPNGDKVDVEDNEVKLKIMEAKIALAQTHKVALQQILLMGVTRLVVSKGEVEAKVNFTLKSNREATRTDKAMLRTTEDRTKTKGASGGIIGGIFGGPRASSTYNKHQTQLSVSSAKSTNTDNLEAELMGRVKIEFKTDYFQLDKFADMFGQGGTETKKEAAAPSK